MEVWGCCDVGFDETKQQTWPGGGIAVLIEYCKSSLTLKPPSKGVIASLTASKNRIQQIDNLNNSPIKTYLSWWWSV